MSRNRRGAPMESCLLSDSLVPRQESHSLRTFLKILAPPLLITAGAAWAGHLRGIPATDLARALPAVLALLIGGWAPGPPREGSHPMSRWLRGSPGRTFGLAPTT